MGELARNKEDETRRYLPRFVCVFSDRTRACWDRAKLAATLAAADQVPPALEGLLQARDSIAPALDLLKKLRQNLPPPPGKDYPEQALIDGLENLASRLPTLTKEDLPADDKLAATCAALQRRGRELLELLERNDDNKEQNPFRQKLIANLQEIMRDLRGAQGLFMDVGIDQPIDMAVTHLELPVQANGQPRQSFTASEGYFVLRAVVKATGQDLRTSVVCRIGEKTMQQPVELKAGEQQMVQFQINCLELAPGPHQLEVRIDPPDLLPFNNSRFLTFGIRQPPRVLVLRENEDDARASYFIKALQALGGDYQVAIEARSRAICPR